MILFVCGIPASGKSSFGKFLRDKYGYFYIDMENSPWPDEQLHSAWNIIFPPNPRDETSVKFFLDAVINKSSNSVLDLGFPVNEIYLWIVPLLKNYGCRIVWFKCTENIARKRYLERDNKPIEWFNTQINNIQQAWSEIKTRINPVIIDVIAQDSSNKSSEMLHRELVSLGVI